MSKEMLVPKFLTQEIAKIAVTNVLKATMFDSGGCGENFSGEAGHVVILVPSSEDARKENFPKWPDYAVKPHALYQQSVGIKENWEYDFESIAQCKALQLWQDRNDGRTDVMPHLLFPGDTPFWGGVKRENIVVTFSGDKQYFDKMISGMIADMCIGLAYHEYMISDDKKNDVCFLNT